MEVEDVSRGNRLTLERVMEWRRVAQEQKDPFLRFVIEYIAFNALYRSKYGYESSDCTIIGKLKKDIPSKIISPKKVEKLKNLAPIANVRNIYIERGRKEITAEDLDDAKNVIDAIYCIRNNLFHGDKQYSLERDQLLVEVGYDILIDINDWLVGQLAGRRAEEEKD